MSVDTEADTHLDQASQCIQEAIKHLSALIVDRCGGHDEYRAEYIENLHQSYTKLIEINRKLGR